jgi:hypothetical protein
LASFPDDYLAHGYAGCPTAYVVLLQTARAEDSQGVTATCPRRPANRKGEPGAVLAATVAANLAHGAKARHEYVITSRGHLPCPFLTRDDDAMPARPIPASH